MLEDGKLQFAADHKRRVRDVVEARSDELAEAHEIFQSGMFRDHPFYESPDPVAMARKALAALSPDLLS